MSLDKVGLIVVDVQNDFCEGGALAVAGGNGVAHRIAKFVSESHRNYAAVVFTQDWHNAPPDDNGGHFALLHEPDYKTDWPVHCVAGTSGAQLHPIFQKSSLPFSGHHVFRKGQGKPDYSGFQGVNSEGKTLDEFLRAVGVDEIHVAGIAGDFCVRHTALDAKSLDYTTYVLPSLIVSVGGMAATYATQDEVAKV